MAALAKVVAASRAEPPPPPSPKGGTLADLSATEKRRVAKLVQQLLAVEKAHQGAQARWRATQADLERRAAAAEAELSRAREDTRTARHSVTIDPMIGTESAACVHVRLWPG